MQLDPLQPDPAFHNQGAAGFLSDNGRSLRSSHPPAAYVMGFEDGAFALGRKLWELVAAGDNAALVEALHAYHAGRAQPVKGWEHAPARN